MSKRDELITALAQLDPVAFEEVVNLAFRQRQDSEGTPVEALPDPKATPQQFAH